VEDGQQKTAGGERKDDFGEPSPLTTAAPNSANFLKAHARGQGWPLTLLTLLLALVTSAWRTMPATADGGAFQFSPGEAVVFAGQGAGHGVGMSQWGARNRALQGQTVAQILSAYYSGATLQLNPNVHESDAQPIRVLLPSRKIQTLRLDAYLASVVASELPAGFPTAALEAQAIASRTYALWRLNPTQPFDVTATVNDQAFGASPRPETNAAVLATQGQILSYAGQPIHAYFHACSPAWTENNEDVWPGPALPYLRGFLDADAAGAPYGADCPRLHWQAGPFSIEQLSHLLATDPRTNVGNLQALTYGPLSPGGRWESLTLQGDAGTKTVTASVFRTVLNAGAPASRTIFSANFAIEPAPAGLPPPSPVAPLPPPGSPTPSPVAVAPDAPGPPVPIPVLPPVATPAPVPHDGRYFSQTGFRVDNDAFWNYFNRRGGVATFGYPTSRVFTFEGFPSQFFQRQVLQLAADGSVRLLNLLDPGLLAYTSFDYSIFPAYDPGLAALLPPPGGAGYGRAVRSFVAAHAPDTWQGIPTSFGRAFSATVTAAQAFPGLRPGDPRVTSLLPLIELEVWGVPTSAPAFDPNNHGFVYLRWQRGVLQYDAGCRCTQGVLLADYLKAIITGQNLPADLAQEAQESPLLGQYDPAQPAWIHNPSLLPNTDLTEAFTPG